MNFKCEQNLLFLWLFLIIQIFVFLSYLKFSSTWNSESSKKSEKLPQAVRFFSNRGPNKNSASNKYKTYYNSDVETEIYLKTENIENYFVTVNNTICFKFGTDMEYMKRNLKILKQTGKCECLTGYHGNDCSLPEIIWRAFIAFRQETVINKRNSKARRIVHMFCVSHPAQIPLVVIKINELFEAVDLFVVIETNQTEYRESKPFHFKIKLDKGLLKEKQYKILYTPVYVGEKDSKKNPTQISWEKSRNLIKNLRRDDLLFYLDSLEIPNPKALLFFKLYDGFSLPLQFRLKWNVYGYFFQHPNKTKKVTTGSTVEALEKIYGNDPNLMERSGSLVVGDLNHYGGWFCDLCYEPDSILNVVQTFNKFETLLSYNTKVVDVKYVEEELLGDGIYIDGKTSLVPNNQDRDPYYSPKFVADNFWKFDSLMINIYSKTDYN